MPRRRPCCSAHHALSDEQRAAYDLRVGGGSGGRGSEVQRQRKRPDDGGRSGVAVAPQPLLRDMMRLCSRRRTSLTLHPTTRAAPRLQPQYGQGCVGRAGRSPAHTGWPLVCPATCGAAANSSSFRRAAWAQHRGRSARKEASIPHPAWARNARLSWPARRQAPTKPRRFSTLSPHFRKQGLLH